MHGSFLSCSLKAQLQTPLHVCISVIEDELKKRLYFYATSYHYRDTTYLFCNEKGTTWHICRLSSEQKEYLIEVYT